MLNAESINLCKTCQENEYEPINESVYYCEDCKKSLCSNCKTGDHDRKPVNRSHICKPLHSSALCFNGFEHVGQEKINLRNQALQKLCTIPLWETDFNNVVLEIVNNLPVLKPHCWFNKEDKEEIDYHSQVGYYCEICKFTFCEKCIKLCVRSTCDNESKVSEQQQQHSKYNSTLTNTDHLIFKCIDMVNELVESIKKWCNGVINNTDVIEKHQTLIEFSIPIKISPIMQSLYFNTFNIIIEKISIRNSTEHYVYEFQKLFSYCNSTAKTIIDEYNNNIYKLLNKLLYEIDQQSSNVKNNLDELCDIQWKNIDENNPIEVCFIGNPKSGKSSTINALLGQKLLATLSTRCTLANSQLFFNDKKGIEINESIIDLSKYDHVPPQYISTIQKKETEPTINVDIQQSTVDIQQSTINHQESTSNVQQSTVDTPQSTINQQSTVKIYWNNLLLKSGICFSDTPGIDDSEEKECKDDLYINSQTIEFIKRASLVILVLPINHDFTNAANRIFNILSLKEMKEKPVMVIINKCNIHGKIEDSSDKGWNSYLDMIGKNSSMLHFKQQIKDKHKEERTDLENCLIKLFNLLMQQGIDISNIFPISAEPALNSKIQGKNIDHAFKLFEQKLFENVEFITRSRLAEMTKKFYQPINFLLSIPIFYNHTEGKKLILKKEKKLKIQKLDIDCLDIENQLTSIVKERENDIRKLLGDKGVYTNELNAVFNLIHLHVSEKIRVSVSQKLLDHFWFHRCECFIDNLAVFVENNITRDETLMKFILIPPLIPIILPMLLITPFSKKVLNYILNEYPKKVSQHYKESVMSTIESEFKNGIERLEFTENIDLENWNNFFKEQDDFNLYNFYCKLKDSFTKLPPIDNKRIGFGSYGRVYSILNDDERAVKKIMKNDMGDQLLLVRELFLSSQLDHPHIAKCYSVNYIDECGYIVLEKLNKFQDVNFDTLSRKIRLRYAIELGLGLDYIHTCNIMHRDIAEANIMIDKMDRIKIIDFGISKFDNGKDHTAKIGHYENMAPEMLKVSTFYAKYDKKVDIFAFGTILEKMFPLNDRDTKIHKLITNCKKEKEERLISWSDILNELYSSYKSSTEVDKLSETLKLEMELFQHSCESKNNKRRLGKNRK